MIRRTEPKLVFSNSGKRFLACRSDDNDKRRCVMARILIVEDERKIARSLVRGFQAAGYDVVAVDNGIAGYEQASVESFDCVVLDILLPGKSGLEVLADLRKTGKSLPVLLLTARDTVEDRVLGLDS